MRAYAKLIAAITVFTVLVILYSNPKTVRVASSARRAAPSPSNHVERTADKTRARVSVWISVTKIARGHLLAKFRKFFGSLVGRLDDGECSDGAAVFELNVITDNASRPTVEGVIRELLTGDDAPPPLKVRIVLWILRTLGTCERVIATTYDF